MIKQILAGIDFGTDSVRTLFCDAHTGEEISSGVSEYPRWKDRRYCDPAANQYRQHALDYIEALSGSFEKAQDGAYPGIGKDIIGIAVDTTGSTPCPVDRKGNPLCLQDWFKENPDAMFQLWKDHTAVEEAKEINAVFTGGQVDYTKYQGVYSSEWYWAKILRTVRKNPEIRKEAYSWIEHSDWIAALLTGIESADEIIRGSCPPAIKPCGTVSSADCPLKRFYLVSIPIWQKSLTDLRKKRLPQEHILERYPLTGHRNWELILKLKSVWVHLMLMPAAWVPE